MELNSSMTLKQLEVELRKTPARTFSIALMDIEGLNVKTFAPKFEIVLCVTPSDNRFVAPVVVPPQIGFQ